MAFENDPEGYKMACGYAGADFEKPKEVRIETFREYGSESWAADNFLALVIEAVGQIPPERRDSAIVELEGGYEESTKLVISYRGPETAEAVRDRVRRCEEYVAEKRAGELATYNRLKAKFG